MQGNSAGGQVEGRASVAKKSFPRPKDFAFAAVYSRDGRTDGGGLPSQMPDDGSDDDLARRAAAGDRAAFATLAERHYDRVHALAWRFTGAQAQAQDIAQDTMVKIAMSIKSFRGDCAFATWAWRIAYRTAIDHKRGSRKVVPFSPQQAEALANSPAEGSPEDDVMGQDLWRAVRALPDQQRDAVLLVYAQDMSHGEAAEVMGCSEKTVSWHLHEARKRLRNTLEAV